MKNKKMILIISGVMVFLLIGILALNSFGLLSSFNLNEKGTFYQSYPQINTASNCYAPQSELDKDWSKEVIIKTDTSTFKIVVTKDPYGAYRSPGHLCRSVLANYDVYRNGALIDTISTDPLANLLKEKNVCRATNPTQMKRAYSDDGTIKGEVEDLPKGMNGIEVNFGAKAYSDGLSNTKGCRKYHIENYFNYVVGDVFEAEINSLFENRIIYEINSPGGYYAVIENKITNLGEIPQTIITNKQLSKGINTITLNVEYDSNSNLQTDIKLYKKTSDFSGLNADASLFEPFRNLVRFNQNTYFEVDSFSLKTLDLEVEVDEPIKEDLRFFGKIWEWIKSLFTSNK